MMVVSIMQPLLLLLPRQIAEIVIPTVTIMGFLARGGVLEIRYLKKDSAKQTIALGRHIKTSTTQRICRGAGKAPVLVHNLIGNDAAASISPPINNSFSPDDCRSYITL